MPHSILILAASWLSVSRQLLRGCAVTVVKCTMNKTTKPTKRRNETKEPKPGLSLALTTEKARESFTPDQRIAPIKRFASKRCWPAHVSTVVSQWLIANQVSLNECWRFDGRCCVFAIIEHREALSLTRPPFPCG
jgi:hypothetical protein